MADEVQFLEWNKNTSTNNNADSDPHDDITPVDDGDIPF